MASLLVDAVVSPLLPLLGASRILVSLPADQLAFCGDHSSLGQSSLVLIVMETESLKLRSSPRLLPDGY